MKIILVKLRNFFVDTKYYLSRSSGYISMINFGMLLLLSLSSLKDKGYFTFDIQNYSIQIYVAFMILMTIIGYVEVNFFGGHKRETQICNAQNLDLQKLINQAEKNTQAINELIKEMKK